MAYFIQYKAIILRAIILLHIAVICSFLLLSIMYQSLFMHQMMDIWVVSRVWQLWIKSLQTFMYRFLYRHKFLFPLSKELGVGWLVYMVPYV